MTTAYHQPTRLDDALKLVAGGATPVAGATSIYTGKSRPEGELVDVTGLGLGTIAVEQGRIALGATATLTQLIEAALPGMEGALLRRAARVIASRPMRNVITVAGNLAHAAFWADMPVALLALDTQVEYQRAGETSTIVPLADALKGRAPWHGGLITRLLVPLREGINGFGHERLSRTANDYAYATAAVTLRRDGAVARDVRVVIGALQPRAFRVPEAEVMLEGQGFEAGLLARAAAKLCGVVPVMPNFRASAEYRRELAGTLARRAMNSAFTWAMQEN